jgi:hypothetical protein
MKPSTFLKIICAALFLIMIGWAPQSVFAQHGAHGGGGGFHGGGGGWHGGGGGWHGGRGRHGGGYYAGWGGGYWGYPGWGYVDWDWDDDGYFRDESSYQPPINTTSPQVIVVEAKDPRPPAPPPEPPKLIEVPPSKDPPIVKQQPPTMFVLTDGERLESRQYLLTVEYLMIDVARRQRRIPLSALDLDATIAGNRARGIELTIPRDRGSVFIGF